MILSANPVFAKDSKHPQAYRAVVARTSHVFTFREEYLNLEQSLCEAHGTGRVFNDMPLLVLTSYREAPVGHYRRWQKEQEDIWRQLQPELARISMRGKHVIAENSSHFIQYDRSELVIEAVREVVESARCR